MTRNEKVELACIVFVSLFLLFWPILLESHQSLGHMLLLLSATLLLQGLIRDLIILRNARKTGFIRSTEQKNETLPVQLICLESSIGLVGVILGAVLLFSPINTIIQLPERAWSLIMSFVLLLGFLIKDYVIGLNPWRIEKDKDHLNIVVGWKL